MPGSGFVFFSLVPLVRRTVVPLEWRAVPACIDEARLILFNWVECLRWKASQCGISIRGGTVFCG